MPVWSVFRREVVGAARNGRVRLILLATVVVGIVGGTVNAQDYRDRQAQFNTRATQLRAALAHGSLMAVFSGDPGLRALRPPEPGSILARGLDQSTPAWWAFDPAGPVEGPRDPSQTADSQTGSVVDLEGLVRIFLSLLALVLGFEAVAGDRAHGVLQAMLNQPIGHRAVLTGKLLAGAAVLAGAILLGASTLLAATVLVSPEAIDRSVIQLVPPLGATGLIYLVALLAGAMLIGSVVRDHAVSGVTIAAVWTYVALIGPQVTTFGSRALVAIPSRPLLEIERQRSFDARFDATERSVGKAYRAAIGAASLGVRPTPTPDEAGIASLGRQWRAEALVTRQIVEAFDERSTNLEQARSRVKSWLMWASPGSLLFEAIADLANTGTATQGRWRDAILAHQRYLNQVFFDNPPRIPLYVPGDLGIGVASENVKLHNDVRARDLASFSATPAPWSVRVRESLPALAGLASYLVACVGLTYLRFPRTGV
jgi:ABC-type transport system involved in multi-copper enzyme maturation permease subunit